VPAVGRGPVQSTAPVPPLAVQPVAFALDQVNVTIEPTEAVFVLLVNVTAGAGAAPTTTCVEVDPLGQLSAYV